jgi:uncharacterized protein (TIGR02099 family)
MNPWTPWLQRLYRWLAALAGLVALLLAVGIGAFRLAIELLPGYQQRIVDEVRAATGLTLQFDSVYARIGRYGPEVVFRGARVLPASGDEPLVTAAAGRVGLSIPRSILYRRLEVARVVFVRPRLSFVITSDGHVRLVGQSALLRPEGEHEPMTLDRLPRGTYSVNDAVLDVLDLRARQGRFQVTGADIDIVRKGDQITLTGHLELPEHLGRSIEFDAEASGDLAENAAVGWRARVDAEDLDLGQWAATLPDSFHVPDAGFGSIQASARGVGPTVTSLRLEPRFRNLRLAGSAEEFTRIAGSIRVQRDGTHESLEATRLELSRPGSPWRPTSVEARLTRRDGRIAVAALRADYLRIENLAALAVALPPGRLRERIQALAPRGELSGVDIVVTEAGEKRLPDVTGRLRFANVGFGPYGKAAGVTGFDGALEGRGAGGIVEIATREATIDWPQQWRAAAVIRRGEGRAEWQRFHDGVRIWLDDAVADTGHGVARGKLRMLLRPGELPLVDLTGTATGFDVTQMWRYLQTGRLSPKTIRWLDAAFRAGRVTKAQVSVTGPTKGFPYREGQGVFRARGHATGIDLHFAPGWPELRGVETDFSFAGPALHAVASRGSIGGVPFTDAEINSGDLREGIFAARGRTSTDAGRAVRMLQATPLAPSFGAMFPELAASGPVTAELAMVLPAKDLDRRVVTVQASLDGVSLRHRQHPAAATGITGDLWVRNREIQAPSLRGRALGGRFEASIATTALAGGHLRTVVSADGTVEGSALAPVAHMPSNAGLAGTAGFHGLLTVERNADPKQPARGTVRIRSDLEGLASSLPEPFAKPADSVRPLAATVSFDGTGGPRIEGSLGRDVRALLKWRDRPGDPPIERGIVQFGSAAPAALPQAAGLWLAGRLESASLTRLLDLEWDGPRGRPIQDYLAGADLAVGRFEALGYVFTGLSGRLRPGDRAWDIAVSGTDVAGRMLVPFSFPGEVPLVLDLDRLRFGERAPGTDERAEPDPRKLPAIRADLRDFVFDRRSFGHVQAEFSRGIAGLTLNRFTMQHPAFTAEGRGSWLVRGDAAECQLEFEAKTQDVKGLMAAMQLGTPVEGEHGRIGAQLSWSGPPEVSAIGRLSGRLEISAKDGNLTAVEPGAGRVFGLMSLAHLPRRLALDFNDLTGEGLSFDTLSGTFRLANGDAYTDNLTLRGSAAEIGLAGHTNLRDRTYDQTAVVTGQLGASLGVAGALAGGPVVGAALLLFSQVFKEPLKGVTRGYYRITGSWEDPQVRRIDARELKEDRLGAAQGPSS